MCHVKQEEQSAPQRCRLMPGHNNERHLVAAHGTTRLRRALPVDSWLRQRLRGPSAAAPQPLWSADAARREQQALQVL